MLQVDTRLTRLDGIRAAPLLRSDLGPVALAITDALQGKTQIRQGRTRGVETVELVTSSYHVVILASDWDRILPYVKDGFFQPEVYPIPHRTDQSVGGPSDLVPNALYPLYQRVLMTLQELFPGDWPGA